MLTQMSIRNFALIEQMNISFNDGITIFTGETGAGKSILMDAFSILLGERASSEFIRHGKDSFVIDGIFDIANHQSIQDLLESKNIMIEEGQLILSRSFNRNGKSSILANDQPIPLKALKEIGQYLADIHGQYSNQRLLDADTHHEYLDTFNKEGKEAYKAYTDAYKIYKQAKQDVEFVITRGDDAAFYITGKRIERLVAMTNLDDDQSLRRFQRIWRFMELDAKLKEKGCKDGDEVVIGDQRFTFQE